MNKKNYLLAAIALTVGSLSAFGQAPAAPAAGAPAAAPRAGGGGRGGLPNATPEQTEAVAAIQTRLTPAMDAVTAARTELATATFAEPRSDANIRAAVAKVQAAELSLANARADEFAKLQASATKLSNDQIQPFITMMGRGAQAARGGGGGGGAAAAPRAGGAGGGAAPAAGAPRGN